MEKYNESLKSYIRSCFSQCQNDSEKEFVSKKLLTKIKVVTTQQGLSTYNWKTEKLVPRSEYWEKQEQMEQMQQNQAQQQQQFQQRQHNFPSRANSQDKKDFSQFTKPSFNKGHQTIPRFPSQPNSAPFEQHQQNNFQQKKPQQAHKTDNQPQVYTGQISLQPEQRAPIAGQPQYGQPPYNPYPNQMPPYQQFNPYGQQYNQPPQYQMPQGYPQQYGQPQPQQQTENQQSQQQQQQRQQQNQNQMPYTGQQQLPTYSSQSPQQNMQYQPYQQQPPNPYNPYAPPPTQSQQQPQEQNQQQQQQQPQENQTYIGQTSVESYSMPPNPYNQPMYNQQQYPPPQYGAQSPTQNQFGPPQYGQQPPMSPNQQNQFQGYQQNQMYPPQNPEYNQYQGYQQNQNQEHYHRKFDKRNEGEEGFHRQGRIFDNRRGGGRPFNKRGRGRGFFPRGNFKNERFKNEFDEEDQQQQQNQPQHQQHQHQNTFYNKNKNFEEDENDNNDEAPQWQNQSEGDRESPIIPISPNKIKLGRNSNDNSDSDYSDFVRKRDDNSSNEYDKSVNSEDYNRREGSDYDTDSNDSYRQPYQQRGFERSKDNSKYNKYYKKNKNGKYNKHGYESDDSSSFGQGSSQYQPILHPLDEEKLDKMIEEKRIIGTSQALEKQYLRLTGGNINPNDFRPLEVLKKSLDYCMEKYEQSHDYTYICDQLRSIRQDISVQNIEDDFAVHVYELHIRLAIDNNDWENFNQVQSNLELLYRKGFGQQENKEEMYCYHILYLCDVNDLTGFYQFIPRIDESLLSAPLIIFAIDAWKAASQNDWMTFFKMMKNAPKQCKKVMQRKAKDIKFYGLTAIARAFKKTTFSMYQEMLCFDNIEDTKEYLKITNVFDSVVDE